MDNKGADLAFSHFLGIGPMKYKKLREVFGSSERAYEASRHELQPILGSMVERFCSFRKEFDPFKKKNEYERQNIHIISTSDSDFPQSFRHLIDPPICLYVKGNKKALKGGIHFAIVGTRKPTSYGKEVTHMFSSQLTQHGLTIVSGLALGIDTQAHKGCLSERGKTVAFLGCGVNIVYPEENRRLYEEIVQNDGAVVSEFPPDMTVSKGLFVSRNRLISGLSIGILVVEGARDSGSLVTARCAAEQGKEVFAVPSYISSPMSEAPHLLIQEGAHLVASAKDIVDVLATETSTQPIINPRVELSSQEEEIVEIIHSQPISADRIARTVDRSISEVLQLISGLEMKNVILKQEDGCYSVRLETSI